MSWPAILVLAAGAYLFKVGGLMLFAEHRAPRWALRAGTLLPAALLAALVLVGTFERDAGGLVLDARAAGLAAAGLAVVLRAPFVVVVIAGAAVTAAVRAL